MNRLSLPKCWNRFFQISLFLLPLLVAFYLARGQVDPAQYAASALFLALMGLAWAEITNRRLLRWVVRGPFLRSALLVILGGYLATELMLLFDFLWGEHASTKSWNTHPWFYFSVVVHVWIFPITLPLFLLCTGVNGWVLAYLYQRRDYLPEEGV